MLLSEIKEFFKKEYNKASSFQKISIGKIDRNIDKTLCFYNSKRNPDLVDKLGLSTYAIKAVDILVRYGRDQDVAEQEIQSLYDFFAQKYFCINDRQVSVKHIYSSPIFLGTDETGIIEYSLEINIYYSKKGGIKWKE